MNKITIFLIVLIVLIGCFAGFNAGRAISDTCLPVDCPNVWIVYYKMMFRVILRRIGLNLGT